MTLYLACVQPPASPKKKQGIIFEGRGHLCTGYLELCIKNILLTCLVYHKVKGTTKPNGLSWFIPNWTPERILCVTGHN